MIRDLLIIGLVVGLAYVGISRMASAEAQNTGLRGTMDVRPTPFTPQPPPAVAPVVNTAPIPVSGGQAELWPGASVCSGTGWHAGAFDYCAPEGTVVYAPASGRFVMQGAYDDTLRFGGYVVIQTDSGIELYIGHLRHATTNPLGFRPGDRVEAGQVVGELGPFPYSTPHAHVQLRRNGALVAPGAWWDAWNQR